MIFLMRRAGKILGTLTVLLIPISVLLLLSIEKAPFGEIGRARDAISDARKVRADRYSDTLFREAEEKYDYAMKLWKEENRKVIFLRDYSRAKTIAEESFIAALGAREDAIVASARERKALKTRLDNTKSQISYFQEIFANLPLSSSLQEDNSIGRLYFAEAELAYREGHFALCDDRLKESNIYLMSSYARARTILEEYFMMWPSWSVWVSETIAGTKGNSSKAILVDKFERKCYIYSKGEIADHFTIDLGSNWLGDKNEKGDRATPEGIYRVARKKDGAETKYYKALLLDYPNKEDRERFTLAKKKGLITRNAEIGGLIEVHGKGGTGVDWTDGCVALADSDMDVLYSLCQTGTRVTIVGSIKPIEEILKKER
ncbi:MAG: hypothetical protein E4G95_07810 [Bacteroidia bacterium]|nr:MAG: hypothetical protein E4G95_07810 [Bacteroidia bacterium]